MKRAYAFAPAACLAPFLLAAVICAPASAQSCNFPAVKQEIDRVIDKEPELGALFRKEFKEGYDPIVILEKILGEEASKRMDICRFDVAEYLAKRGFPPGH